jgi:hypothetical protein
MKDWARDDDLLRGVETVGNRSEEGVPCPGTGQATDDSGPRLWYEVCGRVVVSNLKGRELWRPVCARA